MFASMTFPSEGDADTWLATQRTDLIRGTWKAHDVGAPLLRDYAASWLAGRTDLKPRTAALKAAGPACAGAWRSTPSMIAPESRSR